MIVYGSRLCRTTATCLEDLDMSGLLYEYRDITENLEYMKQFLSLRDRDMVFEKARAQGQIGIPCILRTDGTVTLDWHGEI